MTFSWYFPSNRGGEESGLNDPGVEFFKSTASLSRETIQNIGDARRPDCVAADKPARAVLELMDLDTDSFPGRDRYRRILEACRSGVVDAWPDPDLQRRNGLDFFDRAIEHLSRSSLPILKISDYNTTGLVGDIRDKMGAWYRLLHGQGFHAMQGPGGGTFGIGQRAPFAFSDLRAVFYSSRLDDGSWRFMGKSILCSFPDPDDGDLKRPIGYWGMDSTDGHGVTPVFSDLEIPSCFHREETGTDLYIAGFTRQDWEGVSVLSVLRNFFACIQAGYLQVEIRGGDLGDRVIGRDNIRDCLDEMSSAVETAGNGETGKELQWTSHYLRALEEPQDGHPRTAEIDVLGKVSLYVTRDQDAPGRVAFMRKPRILVYDWPRSIISDFAAVCLCEDEPGNSLLASMEDPSHTKWNPEQLGGSNPDGLKKARRARSELNRFIRETLKELVVQEQPETEDFPELHLWLPEEEDEADMPGPGADESDETSEDESGHTTPKEKKVTVVKRPPRQPPTVSTQSTTTATGDGEGSTGSGEGGTHGSGSKSGPHPGTGTGDRGGEDDDLPGIRPSELQFRSFIDAQDSSSTTYRVVLLSGEDCMGDLTLRAIGEDSRYPIDIIEARDLDGGTMIGFNQSTLQSLRLAARQRKQIQIRVRSHIRLALGTVNR